MRRRSKRVASLTLGGACLVGLAACEDPDIPTQVYRDVAECVQVTGDESTCRNEFASAQARHLATAPRFTSAAACESEYGAGHCQTAALPDSMGTMSNWFIPAIGGFVLGRMLGSPFAQPVYYDSRGYAFLQGSRYRVPGYREDNYRGGGYSSTSYSYNRTSSPPSSASSWSRPGGSYAAASSFGRSSASLAGPSSSRGGFGSSFSRFSSGG